MTEQHKKDPIPAQMSREELAHFWETHSIADYVDELKPLKVHFEKNLSQGLTVRFDTPTLTAVEQEAHQKGIGASTLIRMVVKDYFRTHRDKRSMI